MGVSLGRCAAGEEQSVSLSSIPYPPACWWMRDGGGRGGRSPLLPSSARAFFAWREAWIVELAGAFSRSRSPDFFPGASLVSRHNGRRRLDLAPNGARSDWHKRPALEQI